MEISHGKGFYSNFKVENIFFPIATEGNFQNQGTSGNSLHHYTVLTTSNKHLEIPLACDSFLLKANNGSLQMYIKYNCYHKIFF